MAEGRVEMTLTRSEIMSRIKSNSQEEKTWRKELRKANPRLRRGKILECQVDAIDRKERVAYFYDSCFWHWCVDHPPKVRTVWWFQKLLRNACRDVVVTARLEAAGWEVARVWSH